MKILGIESSCDETAAAVIEVTRNNPSTLLRTRIQVTNNVVWSQVEVHKKYGGVVPEVAARQHVEAIMPVIQEALEITNDQYPISNQNSITNVKFAKPDLIAVTQGPGLITSLQVGLQTAKTLAYAWDVPLVGVNHLEGHVWSYLLNKETRSKIHPLRPRSEARDTKKSQKSELPAIGLIVSGGHTELILIKDIGKYELIGQTRDDAVGEAFDKVAKMLELGYPGGPIIAHFAQTGDPHRIEFPRPMMDSGDFDFSFSGLKTAVKYHLKQMTPTGNLSSAFIKDVCASFQQAAIDVLVHKTVAAAQKHKVKSVILGGGVSANELLIKELGLRIENLGLDFYYPEKWLTGDNAAMIALAGYFNRNKASISNWQKLTAEANLRMV